MRSWITVPATGLLAFLLCIVPPAYSAEQPSTKAPPKKEVRTKKVQAAEKSVGTQEKCPPPVEIGKIREQKEDVTKSRQQIKRAREKLRQEQRGLKRDLRNQRIDRRIVKLQQQIQRLDQQMLELEQRKLGLTQKMLQLQQQKLK